VSRKRSHRTRQTTTPNGGLGRGGTLSVAAWQTTASNAPKICQDESLHCGTSPVLLLAASELGARPITHPRIK